MPQNRWRSRGPNVTVFVVIGVVVLGIVAVLVSRGDDGDDDGGGGGEAVTRPVEVSGAALPTLTDPAADLAVGTAAPAVSGTSLAGRPLTVGGGGPAVVAFVAHWCPHCQAEVPVIVDWLAENGEPEGVAFLAVSTAVAEERGNYPPGEWLARERWDVPTLVDDEGGSGATAFGLSGFPFFVAIGGDGEVVARVSGELGVTQLEALVDAARSG